VDDLKKAQENVIEAEKALEQLRRRFSESKADNSRILKLCSEFGAHVQPLPVSYEALMESVQRFYGDPPEGSAYVVSWNEIHILT
jgi:hypothetical protein